MINLLRSASRVSAVLAMLMYFNTLRLLRAGPARPAIVRDDFFISARVMRLLVRTGEGAMSLPDHELILVAEDLSPSDAATLNPDLVKGI